MSKTNRHSYKQQKLPKPADDDVEKFLPKQSKSLRPNTTKASESTQIPSLKQQDSMSTVDMTKMLKQYNPDDYLREDLLLERNDELAPESRWYIPQAIIASLLFGAAGLLRKYLAGSTFLANCIVSATFVTFGVVYLIVSAIIARSTRKEFRFPWQTPSFTQFHGASIFRTDLWLLGQIGIGGFLQYIGVQAQIILYNSSGNLSGVITSLNTIFIAVAAYFLFNERHSWIKMISILLLMLSIPFTLLFSNQAGVQPRLQVASSALSTTAFQNQLIMSCAGLVASLCFAIYLLLFKHISNKQPNSISVVFTQLLFGGVLGCIITAVIQGMIKPVSLSTVAAQDVGVSMVIGILTSIAVILSSLSVAKGHSSATNAIINCSLVIVVLFNATALHQGLTIFQIIGICLAGLGASILAADKTVRECLHIDKPAEEYEEE